MPYIMQDENITLFVIQDGSMQPITVASTHPNFIKIRDAIKEKDFDTAVSLADIPVQIEKWGAGNVEVRGGSIYYKGKSIDNSVVSRILKMIEEGFDVQPMLRFLDNLMLNPSNQSVQELYDFLDFSDLPITDDGCFLAYKAVSNDFKDFRTGTMDNSVGSVVEMPRNEVDDNRDNTCSTGLHFTSLTGYVKWFGNANMRVVAIKINPRDVVSIPTDYDNKKGRCCKYEVFGDITEKVIDNDQDFLEEHTVVSSEEESTWDYSTSML